MIDVDVRATVADGTRRFELAARFASTASMVALYGPSGAGKSLTLQAIAGLLRPDQGHVRVGGRVLYESNRDIDLPPDRRRIGYLFQHYALFPHLCVRDNIAFGLTNWWRRRLAPAEALRIDGLMESFGLAELAGSRPAALSGGQQQRVALARALACAPDLLLLDEPFSALNPLLRQDLRRELAAVCKTWNTPVVMITHDIEDVLALAEVAFVVEQGQVVREIDVRKGESRDLARRALAPNLPPPRTDDEPNLHAMLQVLATL